MFFRPYICVIFGAPLQSTEIKSLRTPHLEGRTNSNSNQDWDVFLTHASGKFSASTYKTPPWWIFGNPLALPPRLPSNGCILLLLKLHQVGNGFLLGYCAKSPNDVWSWKASIYTKLPQTSKAQPSFLHFFVVGVAVQWFFHSKTWLKQRLEMFGIDHVLRSESSDSSPPRFWSRDLAPEFLGGSYCGKIQGPGCKWIWKIMFTLQLCKVLFHLP